MKTAVHLAWLAGIVDGEGSVYVGRRPRKKGIYFQPGLVVTMTHKSTMRLIAKMSGRPLYTHVPGYPGAKQYWTVRWWNQQAATQLQQLLPYLVTKHHQALALIELAALQARSRRLQVYKAGRQRVLYDRVKRLNA